MNTLREYTKFKDTWEQDPDLDAEMSAFLHQWEQHAERYGSVSGFAEVPAALLAALHWRESTGSFSCYLSNGDKLGTVTYVDGRSNNGKAIPHGVDTVVFDKFSWDGAAIFAIQHEVSALKESGITQFSGLDVCCDFAERFNGLGYVRRGLTSPYVLSGTDGYSSGKFVSDGHYDSKVIDRQLGVLPMLRALKMV